MTTAQDLVDQVRAGLEDWGTTVTETITLNANDPVDTVYQLASLPIKTSPQPTMDDDGTAKTLGSDWTLNYNNGEVTVKYIQTNTHVLTFKFTKVIWRDERILGALKAGIRVMSRKVYFKGEAYVDLRSEVYDYDLANTTDVPATSAFDSGIVQADYVPATARADLQKATSTIHFAEYRPVGTISSWRPFTGFRRTTQRGLHIECDPTEGDVLKLVYSAPLSVPENLEDELNVPSEFLDLPVWYAMGMLVGRKESVRVRSDGYQSQSAANANPVGAQARAGTDFMALFWSTFNAIQMRPMRTTIRTQIPAFLHRGP